MKASTERRIIRWLHIILAAPIIGYFYASLAKLPQAKFAIQVFFLPAIAVSGLWLWKGQAVKKWIRPNKAMRPLPEQAEKARCKL